MKWFFKIRFFSLNIGAYTFSPGVFVTLLTIALVTLTYSLGQWQLSRANYKDNLQQKIAERQNKPPIGFKQLPYDMSEREYLPVSFEGQYDTEHSILLDNRVVDSVVGYEVFTPFKMANEITVIVNRGFVPLGKYREDLPVFDTPDQVVVIKGLMEKTPSSGLILSKNIHQNNKWPAVLQYIEIAELETMFKTSLMKMIVRLAEDGPGGLKYHQPVVNLNSAKNNGYAFQWFAMMSAILSLYFVVNTKKRTN
ncbi:MAG: SURF1 family protein [Gammaproteobacteria bacterium]|nr:SURF1 family protein [Gammaproteobacteria bacterium]